MPSFGLHNSYFLGSCGRSGWFFCWSCLGSLIRLHSAGRSPACWPQLGWPGQLAGLLSPWSLILKEFGPGFLTWQWRFSKRESCSAQALIRSPLASCLLMSIGQNQVLWLRGEKIKNWNKDWHDGEYEHTLFHQWTLHLFFQPGFTFPRCYAKDWSSVSQNVGHQSMWNTRVGGEKWLREVSK